MSREEENMDFANYQLRTSQTAIYPPEKALEYLTLGLVSEAGEVAGKVKKIIRDHDSVLTEENKEKLLAEIGDVLWYIAQLCETLGTNMSLVARNNVEKLAKRQEKNALSGDGDNR
jgi:NTP pyrophosphatase (non-canonical NTP hydrolase)